MTLLPLRKYQYLLIDGSNLYHRSYHIGKGNFELHKSKDLKFHVLKSCLETIDNLISQWGWEESEIYFLFDNTQSQINTRKIIDPTYKSNRDRLLADKELYSIHNILIEILKRRNSQYRILTAGSLEADDLVKPLLKILPLEGRTLALMISNDMDWSRNMTGNIHWYNWRDNLDKDGFFSKYKFYPSEESVKIYKAIKGDSSDHIPASGCHLSPESFDQIINDAYQFKSYSDFINYIETLDEKVKHELKLHLKVIRKNYQLVDFINLEVPIQDYVYFCKFEPVSLRLWLRGSSLPIPDHLKDKKELLDDFFR